MRTAVIGANGFIGSRLVESFHLGEGPAVVPVVRHVERANLAARFALDVRVADALDDGALTDALDGCGAAVHVVRGEAADCRRLATVFCRAAARAGVKRLVYVGSAIVHGHDPAPETNEKSRIDVQALDETAAAQLAAERQFFSECRRLNLTGYALRPGIVFGPRSPLVAAIIQELRLERAWLLGRGEAICNTVYVDNLVAAVRLCLRAKAGTGQAYLLGDAETVTWRDFYHAIARELDLGTRRIQYLDSPPPDADASRPALQHARARLSFAAATRVLGYQPPVSFADGVRRTCAWWRFASGDFFAAA